MVGPAKVDFDIPGYKIVKRLGTGAQASVFRATQLSMNREVAIKVIPPSAHRKEADLARFLREARVLARLHHENIVRAIDYGEVEGNRYLSSRSAARWATLPSSGSSTATSSRATS